jgi:putative effector of murein hydrolase LrgA (UPF0299 family)
MKHWAIKTPVASAIVGMSVALGLAVIWRLINFDYISVSSEAYDMLSSVSLILCPTSLVLMEVGPREAISGEVAALYATVIVANGLVYGIIALLAVAIFRVSKRFGKQEANPRPTDG